MENLDKIEKFLTGKMPPAEAEAFKREIANSEALAREVNMQRLELTAIELLAKEDLRTEMKKVLEEEKPFERLDSERQASRRFRVKFTVAAATIILLFWACFFLWPTQLSKDRLVEVTYEKVPPNFDIKKGDGTTSLNREYMDIIIDWNHDRAKEAITYFLARADSSGLQTDKLNLAHAYMVDRNYQQALALFTEIENNQNSNALLKQEARYYKASALIGIDEAESARAIFQQLLSTRYKDAVGQMLQLME